ncbi:MAG: ABC transporter ATP-binding protein [Proteobacteria bacterium]|nr:ABC transporter ATP-binding protein [Pseudomonadota bacterium]
MTDSLLRVEHLVTSFRTDRGLIRAVDDISFSINKGQTVGLVGESGCGKSVTSLSILRLIQSPPGRIEPSSKIIFGGEDIVKLSEPQMRRLRGNRISMIFQEPMTSLNPVFTIGDQIGEVFRIHRGASKKEARERSIEMLRLVRMAAPEQRVDEYPHQLSGGMRQRIMIAMALACRPELLIADEPTTALDVTIQAQILDLMANLQRELNMAILLITHDLGVVAEVCDYVIVMYAGRIAEQGSVEAIFRAPTHPYSVGLLNSIPRLGHKTEYLPTIEGTVPSLANLPKGCRFQDRCKHVHAKCREQEPPLRSVAPGHEAACWLSP